MTTFELVKGDPVPEKCHVARYCFPCTVKLSTGQDSRPIVTARAFEKGRDRTADVSLSVMEKFTGADDNEVIYEVCRQRGYLNVREGGHYVKLNVGLIKKRRFGADRRELRLIFDPGPNPAHAVLYTEGLMISLELAALATERGTLFPVPDPVPEVVFPA